MTERYVSKKDTSHRLKVKSGCKTCKRRKVKCDEKWPACNRCQSTGRSCDGYGIWGGGSHANNMQQMPKVDKIGPLRRCIPKLVEQESIAQSVPSISLQGKELESFEWFVLRSAVKLAGDFASREWTTLLLQMSVTEPSIRHAVLALSSAHKEEVRGLGRPGQPEYKDEQAIFTVAQYSKAIKFLKPSLAQSKSHTVQVACVSCVLFIWTDFLRGHYADGLVHLRHGMKLFLENRAIKQDWDTHSDYVDGWLITMFTRLLVQAKISTQLDDVRSLCFLRLGQQGLHDTFKSVLHARRSLDHLLLRAMELKQQAAMQQLEALSDDHCSLLDDQDELQTDLRIWLHTCEATISTVSSTTQIQELCGYQLLKIHHHVAVELAGTGLEPCDELACDRYTSTFQAVVDDCAAIYQHFLPMGKFPRYIRPDPEPSSPNSLIEMGWIAPLCYVACRCRDPYIRRQAISLLKRSPHKEGIWNAELTVIIVEMVVELEESGFYDSLLKQEGGEDVIQPSAEDIVAMPVLPRERRLNGYQVNLPHDKVGKLSYVFHRQDQQGVRQQYYREYDLCTRKWSAIRLCPERRKSSPLIQVNASDLL